MGIMRRLEFNSLDIRQLGSRRRLQWDRGVCPAPITVDTSPPVLGLLSLHEEGVDPQGAHPIVGGHPASMGALGLW